MIESEIFDCENNIESLSSTYKNRIISEFYSILRVILLDAFEDRYEIFLLPRIFDKNWKASLQNSFRKFEYKYVIQKDKDFLISVFNNLDSKFGKEPTLLLLDWIKNAGDIQANEVVGRLNETAYDIKEKKLKPVGMPLRLERFYSFQALLLDQFNLTSSYHQLSSTWLSTAHDVSFYKLQEYDYLGDKEITFDPSDHAYAFGSLLYSKIAWENTCQGYPPTEQEMTEISEWIAHHNGYWKHGQHMLQHLFISPLLKEDLLKRRVIATP